MFAEEGTSSSPTHIRRSTSSLGKNLVLNETVALPNGDGPEPLPRAPQGFGVRAEPGDYDVERPLLVRGEVHRASLELPERDHLARGLGPHRAEKVVQHQDLDMRLDHGAIIGVCHGPGLRIDDAFTVHQLDAQDSAIVARSRFWSERRWAPTRGLVPSEPEGLLVSRQLLGHGPPHLRRAGTSGRTTSCSGARPRPSRTS